MARCPFAEWHHLGADAGPFTGGPVKIVHHTTEGSTAAGAFSALQRAHAESHFVVDADKIYQLIDTGRASKSLRNDAGGVQTNKDGAIQIEMVGFAGKPKNRKTLDNVRRLCRWIEETHGVPKVWPNGYPKPSKNGNDPGGHNRNAANWDTKGGHYGHSQVPENTHWDPAYSVEEVEFLMGGPVPAEEGDKSASKTFIRVKGVAPDTLNLREGPSADSRDIGDLPEGTVLTILSVSGDWTEVVTPYAKVRGFVATRYTVRA